VTPGRWFYSMPRSSKRLIALLLVFCLIAESGGVVPAREALCVKREAMDGAYARASAFEDQALAAAATQVRSFLLDRIYSARVMHAAPVSAQLWTSTSHNDPAGNVAFGTICEESHAAKFYGLNAQIRTIFEEFGQFTRHPHAGKYQAIHVDALYRTMAEKLPDTDPRKAFFRSTIDPKKISKEIGAVRERITGFLKPHLANDDEEVEGIGVTVSLNNILQIALRLRDRIRGVPPADNDASGERSLEQAGTEPSLAETPRPLPPLLRGREELVRATVMRFGLGEQGEAALREVLNKQRPSGKELQTAAAGLPADEVLFQMLPLGRSQWSTDSRVPTSFRPFFNWLVAKVGLPPWGLTGAKDLGECPEIAVVAAVCTIGNFINELPFEALDPLIEYLTEGPSGYVPTLERFRSDFPSLKRKFVQIILGSAFWTFERAKTAQEPGADSPDEDAGASAGPMSFFHGPEWYEKYIAPLWESAVFSAITAGLPAWGLWKAASLDGILMAHGPAFAAASAVCLLTVAVAGYGLSVFVRYLHEKLGRSVGDAPVRTHWKSVGAAAAAGAYFLILRLAGLPIPDLAGLLVATVGMYVSTHTGTHYAHNITHASPERMTLTPAGEAGEAAAADPSDLERVDRLVWPLGGSLYLVSDALMLELQNDVEMMACHLSEECPDEIWEKILGRLRRRFPETACWSAEALCELRKRIAVPGTMLVSRRASRDEDVKVMLMHERMHDRLSSDPALGELLEQVFACLRQVHSMVLYEIFRCDYGRIHWGEFWTQWVFPITGLEDDPNWPNLKRRIQSANEPTVMEVVERVGALAADIRAKVERDWPGVQRRLALAPVAEPPRVMGTLWDQPGPQPDWSRCSAAVLGRERNVYSTWRALAKEFGRSRSYYVPLHLSSYRCPWPGLSADGSVLAARVNLGGAYFDHNENISGTGVVYVSYGATLGNPLSEPLVIVKDKYGIPGHEPAVWETEGTAGFYGKSVYENLILTRYHGHRAVFRLVSAFARFSNFLTRRRVDLFLEDGDPIPGIPGEVFKLQDSLSVSPDGAQLLAWTEAEGKSEVISFAHEMDSGRIGDPRVVLRNGNPVPGIPGMFWNIQAIPTFSPDGQALLVLNKSGDEYVVIRLGLDTPAAPAAMEAEREDEAKDPAAMAGHEMKHLGGATHGEAVEFHRGVDPGIDALIERMAAEDRIQSALNLFEDSFPDRSKENVWKPMEFARAGQRIVTVGHVDTSGEFPGTDGSDFSTINRYYREKWDGLDILGTSELAHCLGIFGISLDGNLPLSAFLVHQWIPPASSPVSRYYDPKQAPPGGIASYLKQKNREILFGAEQLRLRGGEKFMVVCYRGDSEPALEDMLPGLLSDERSQGIKILFVKRGNKATLVGTREGMAVRNFEPGDSPESDLLLPWDKIRGLLGDNRVAFYDMTKNLEPGDCSIQQTALRVLGISGLNVLTWALRITGLIVLSIGIACADGGPSGAITSAGSAGSVLIGAAMFVVSSLLKLPLPQNPSLKELIPVLRDRQNPQWLSAFAVLIHWIFDRRDAEALVTLMDIGTRPQASFYELLRTAHAGLLTNTAPTVDIIDLVRHPEASDLSMAWAADRMNQTPLSSVEDTRTFLPLIRDILHSPKTDEFAAATALTVLGRLVYAWEQYFGDAIRIIEEIPEDRPAHSFGMTALAALKQEAKPWRTPPVTQVSVIDDVTPVENSLIETLHGKVDAWNAVHPDQNIGWEQSMIWETLSSLAPASDMSGMRHVVLVGGVLYDCIFNYLVFLLQKLVLKGKDDAATTVITLPMAAIRIVQDLFPQREYWKTRMGYALALLSSDRMLCGVSTPAQDLNEKFVSWGIPLDTSIQVTVVVDGIVRRILNRGAPQEVVFNVLSTREDMEAWTKEAFGNRVLVKPVPVPLAHASLRSAA